MAMSCYFLVRQTSDGERMTSTAAEVHNHARGDYRAPALFRRAWRPETGIYRRFSHLVVLTDGAGRLRLPDGVCDLTAPTAAFMPTASRAHVELSAGSDGYLLGVSEELMVDAIGNRAESVQLRILVERPAVTRVLGGGESAEITALARGFIDELNRQDRGSWMALAAYMRLLLISVRRTTDAVTADAGPQVEAAPVLQRFRQLVELHFRDHWTVRAYVHELGVTYDRLHALCRRKLGRSPIQLVHERILREACLRLERSASSVQQVSDGLGYNDPTYFSHFFKHKTGYSPAAYRNLAGGLSQSDHPRLSSGFSDWP